MQTPRHASAAGIKRRRCHIHRDIVTRYLLSRPDNRCWSFGARLYHKNDNKSDVARRLSATCAATTGQLPPGRSGRLIRLTEHLSNGRRFNRGNYGRAIRRRDVSRDARE